MILPKKVKVGRKWYVVHKKETGVQYGMVCYKMGIIHVATKNKTGKYSKTLTRNDVSDTFWHELTHAILHDMGDFRNNNENFVAAFSSRLNIAINSAKF